VCNNGWRAFPNPDGSVIPNAIEHQAIGQAVMTRRVGPPELLHQEQAYARN
jgi:hypothetical protein